MSYVVEAHCHERRFGSAVRKQIIMFLANKASDDGSGIWCSKGFVQARAPDAAPSCAGPSGCEGGHACSGQQPAQVHLTGRAVQDFAAAANSRRSDRPTPDIRNPIDAAMQLPRTGPSWHPAARSDEPESAMRDEVVIPQLRVERSSIGFWPPGRSASARACCHCWAGNTLGSEGGASASTGQISENAACIPCPAKTAK